MRIKPSDSLTESEVVNNAHLPEATDGSVGLALEWVGETLPIAQESP